MWSRGQRTRAFERRRVNMCRRRAGCKCRCAGQCWCPSAAALRASRRRYATMHELGGGGDDNMARSSRRSALLAARCRRCRRGGTTHGGEGCSRRHLRGVCHGRCSMMLVATPYPSALPVIACHRVELRHRGRGGACIHPLY